MDGGKNIAFFLRIRQHRINITRLWHTVILWAFYEVRQASYLQYGVNNMSYNEFHKHEKLISLENSHLGLIQ